MRALWSGSISFGLVNIPVKLQAAIDASQSIDLDMLSKKDMAPIRYARIDTKTNKEVAWKDIVKGFQYQKGKYVVVTDEDFAKASPEKSESIDIIQFVADGEIDPIYFEKPYYIVPDKTSARAYHLLIKALEKTKTVGLAEFMLRNRSHVCAIRSYNGVLLLNQMRYDEELREVPEVGAVKSAKDNQRELDLAVKLIEQLTETFNPADFKDTYVNSLKKLIQAKAAGRKTYAAKAKKNTATVKDLMSILKQSLEGNGKKKRA